MAKKTKEREWFSPLDRAPTKRDADKQGRVLWRRAGGSKASEIKSPWEDYLDGHAEEAVKPPMQWSPLSRIVAKQMSWRGGEWKVKEESE